MPTRKVKKFKLETAIKGLIKGRPGEVKKSRSFYRGSWNRTTHA